MQLWKGTIMSTEFFEVNGVRVANIKSDSEIAVFAIDVLAGSNYEWPEVAGISHFTEHMFFKGTEKMDWREINQRFAKLGVDNNAFTSNNDVMYHTTCPRENISKVIDLMMDMFFHSTIPEIELEKERGVIKEEKQCRDDDPKASFDLACCEKFFKWELGHDVIGTFDRIKNISRDDMVEYLQKRTNLANFMFICSGNIDSDDLRKYIANNMPTDHPYLMEGELNKTSDILWVPDTINKSTQVKFSYERENIAQSCVSMFMQGLSRTDDLYFSEKVAMKALGGGMYSKLFARLREELGLCYSTGISGYGISYPNLAVNELYGHMSPENVDKFIEEANKVLKDFMREGLDDDIFECAKTDLLAQFLRMTETSFGKLGCLSKRYLTGEYGHVEDIIKDLRAVKIEDCNMVVEKLLAQDYNWAIMLPKGD